MSRGACWLLVLVALVGVVGFMLWAGDEWSEAIVQGLAGLGGLWFWVRRTRPRVTLRVRSRNGAYLELSNVGSRVARQVTVRCSPPIPWQTTLAMAPREEFGPVEDFGDMSPDQRYVVLVGGPGPRLVDVLDRTTFEVSHERTWWVGRCKSTMRFGGSGGRSTLNDDAPSSIGEIAKTVERHGEKLDKIGNAIETIGRRLPPETQEA